jgi:hypothetical protein
MPCTQCDDGKWRWGSGPCEYDSQADCEAANRGEREESGKSEDEEEKKDEGG